MALVHIYFAMEDIALTAQQRADIINALKQLGANNNSRQPSEIIHWRISLDGSKAIFEAKFDEDSLTIQTWKNRLAGIAGISASLVDHTVSNVELDTLNTPIVTLLVNGIARMRLALFGGVGATKKQSQRETQAYIGNNIEEWESVE